MSVTASSSRYAVELKDLGADPKKLEYLAMDADESDVPKGPNGKKALTALKEEAAKKKPASPKR